MYWGWSCQQQCFFEKAAAKRAGACRSTNKRTLKNACCVETEADEARPFTCKVVVFHVKTGHESRGRTLPGLLQTLGTLLLLRPSQELRIAHTEQRRDSCCSLAASHHSLCQRIGRVTHIHVRQCMAANAVSDANNCLKLKLAVLSYIDAALYILMPNYSCQAEQQPSRVSSECTGIILCCILQARSLDAASDLQQRLNCFGIQMGH